MTAIAPLTKRAAWKALEVHYSKIRELHLRKLFADDAARGERMAVEAVGIYLDYSKQRITDETLALLLQLAKESDLTARINAMFHGEKINVTEKRAVLHVALRLPKGNPSSWTAKTWFPKCMPCSTKWPTSQTECAGASGKATPASRSEMSSISASAVLTWDP